MKKIIYQILVIALVMGSIGIIPSVATNVDQDAIDFLVDNGYWKEEGDFGASQPATRAQAASVFANLLSELTPSYTGNYSDVSSTHKYFDDIALATNLGLVSGSSGTFRPDDALTREELAVMLVRAYEIAGVNLLDTNYLTELIKDYDSINDWAKTSVTDALGNGLMIGGEKKMFNPQTAVTRAELANAVYRLYYAEKPGKITYTVRDVTAADNIKADFNVLQDSGVYVSLGMGGIGMIARFNGAPGEIYVRREKGDFDSRLNNMAPAVSFARVIGPDGNVICRVDMDWLEKGTMEKIINIPEGPAGIYQIQFNNAIHLDSVSIGVKNPVSWGLRGEDNIMFTDTTPKEGYIYVPEKFDHLSIAIAGKNTQLQLYGNDKKTLIGSVTGKTIDDPGRMNFTDDESVTNTNKYSPSLITPGGVLKYKVPADFTGRLGMTGISPVIYPTEAMARDLKSGYVMHTDKYATLQLSGPLQVRARERMVEIYDELGGDLDVDVRDKYLTSVPNDLDNPLAEAQLYASYSNAVHNMRGRIDTQCIDPTSPWFGSFILIPRGEWQGVLTEDFYPTEDWQTGNYNIENETHAFTGLSINAETNPYYNDPELVKRAELFCLYLITQMPADGMVTYRSTEDMALYTYFRKFEQFFWGNHGFAESYYRIRNYLSPETRSITDEGMLINADKLMNMTGQTPTNQLLMAMAGTVYTYAWSGMDIYHENAKRQIMGMLAPCEKDYRHGQSKLGYFIESEGADGASYGKMSESLWHVLVHTYLSLPESMQDPELKAAIIKGEELYQTWDSYFIMPNTEHFKRIESINWTSREDGGLGRHSVVGENGYLINIFPKAKKIWLVQTLGRFYNDYKTVNYYRSSTSDSFGSGSNAFVITNDEWAKSHLRQYIPGRYDAYDEENHPSGYMAAGSEMYYVWHQDQKFNDKEMPSLPYEAEGDYEFFINENGIVSFKHKGLYVLSYFNNSMPGTPQSNISWMGGGPTNVWDDYFATTLSCRKIVDVRSKFNNYYDSYNNADYTRLDFTQEDVRHSAIVGTDVNGKIFISGREKSTFSWIEQNKSFRLSGRQLITTTSNGTTTTVQDKNIIWDYYLTDAGVSIAGGVDAVTPGEILYMQLPIVAQKGSEYTIDRTNRTIVIEHNGNTMTYKWNSPNVVINEETTSEEHTYITLKIKLTVAAPMATVDISRTLAS